jgi:predicted metal-dependent HD superfamily phosphohydrolase
MSLRDKWVDLWKRAGGRESGWLRPYERLVERYSEPHRHYHTLAHIQHCLEEFEAMRGVPPRGDAVEMAIWFHDAVYDPKADDNEARSGALAKIVLDVGCFADEFISRVRYLVMETAHADEHIDMDSKVMVDVDLAILGQREQAFDEYERQIRREYAWVPDEKFRAGRAEFLKGFLARPRIYSTLAMFATYEKPARANLARSLDRLRRGEIIA